MNKSSPLVTYAIPAYNHAQFISKCIMSIQRQHLSDIEIIVSDDGSLDETVSIARHFASKDDRIRVISNPNQGITSNRNRCLSYARGEFICFIDSDDEIFPDHGTRLLNALIDNPRAIFSFGDCFIVSQCGMVKERFSRIYPRRGGDHLARELYLTYCFVPSVASMIRTEALRSSLGYTGSGLHTDYIKWIELATIAGGVNISGPPIANWHMHEFNASTRDLNKIQNFYTEQANSLWDLYQGDRILQQLVSIFEAKRRCARSYLTCAFFLVIRKQWSQARNAVENAERIQSSCISLCIKSGLYPGIRWVLWSVTFLLHWWIFSRAPREDRAII